GYFGSFLSSYLGTGDPITGSLKPGEEAQARIEDAFVARTDQREPRPLRHLRNRSRYLVDDSFVRKSIEIVMVAAGILFNLLIVLPVALVAALLTLLLNRSHFLGEPDWTRYWFPGLSAPVSMILLPLLVLSALAVFIYPILKAGSLKSMRHKGDS